MGLDLPANQAPLLLAWFNSFVGYSDIKNRIARVENKLNSALGLSDAILRRYQFHTTYKKLMARKAVVEGRNGAFEVDCKTFADNIGNAISTDLSIAIFEELRRAIDRNGFPESATYEILVRSVPAPPPSAFGSAANSFFNATGESSYDGFQILRRRRHDFDARFESEGNSSWVLKEFSEWQRGANNHSMVAASAKAQRVVFISITGSRPPRPYNAICERLKSASKQFSKRRPAVIWGHFLGLNETEMKALLERNFNERNAFDFFGEYLFRSENRNHVARLRLSADGDIRIGTDEASKIAYGGGPAYDLTSKVSRFDSKLVDEY